MSFNTYKGHTGFGRSFGLPGRDSSLFFGLDPRTPTYKRQPHAACCGLHIKSREFFDPEILRVWLDVCDSNHQCRASRHGSSGHFMRVQRPAWVVDVVGKCLVKPGPHTKYMALSYVWGKVDTFKTLRNNIQSLQQPGFLSPSNGVHLARTIQNAMDLVQLVGHRYLWVDSLCIVQDDEKSKHSEISAMGSIYSGAYCTIIASSGADADHGIPRLWGISDPKQRPSGEGVWYQRGWTFQESLLSRRKIFFDPGEVRWFCESTMWYETRTSTIARTADDFGPSLVEGFGWQKLTFPDLNHYKIIVEKYHTRDFTFPQDSLSAFAGITAQLSSVFPGGFVGGLPRMYLDVALLWQPHTDTEGLQRRGIEESAQNTGAHPQIPSWSWAAWKGRIDFSGWKAGYNFFGNHGSPWEDLVPEVIPITRFSLDPESKRDTTTAEMIHYRRYEAMSRSDRAPLPRGWSLAPQNRKSWDRRDKIQYVHQKINHGTGSFDFPIPLMDEDSLMFAPDNSPSSRPPRLYFRAQTAVFRIDARVGLGIGRRRQRRLFDGSGAWCGTLLLHSNNSNTCISSPSTQDDGEEVGGADGTFIAISKGRYDTTAARTSSLGWKSEWIPVRDDDEGGGAGVFEFYNVLWVGSNGTVLYRKALGIIMKSAWEAISPEEVDVCLG